MNQSNEILDSVNITTPISDYKFPLEFEFKIGTLANDFRVKEQDGALIAYVRQKMFKFKEAIQIFSDESKERVIFTIGADRIIDFNASYIFKDENGEKLGHVGRKGMRSLLKAHYEIYDNNQNQEFLISEENPWTKFWDALLCEVPLVGLLSGYMFNPRYIVKRPDGTDVIRLSKEKSFWGRRFKLEKLSETDKSEDERLMLGLMMMTLLERRRG